MISFFYGLESKQGNRLNQTMDKLLSLGHKIQMTKQYMVGKKKKKKQTRSYKGIVVEVLGKFGSSRIQ